MIQKPFEEMSPDERLEFSQGVRHDVINTLITNGQGKREIDYDKDKLYLLSEFLKGSEKVELTKKRMDVDTAISENDRKAAEILESVIARSAGVDRTQPAPRREIQADVSKLPRFDLTDGETSGVGDIVDLDDIKAKGRDHFKGEDSPELLNGDV